MTSFYFLCSFVSIDHTLLFCTYYILYSLRLTDKNQTKMYTLMFNVHFFFFFFCNKTILIQTQLCVIFICCVHSPTVDDAFHVEHWNDFENICVSDFFRRDRIAAKIFDHAIDHPRRAGFARVHARSQVHDRTVLYLCKKNISTQSFMPNVLGISNEWFKTNTQNYI